MPLRDTRALRDWARASAPSDDLWNLVVGWIAELHTKPYRTPSIPVEEQSDRPNYEVRRARPAGDVLLIEYRHIYNGDFVDLLRVEPS